MKINEMMEMMASYRSEYYSDTALLQEVAQLVEDEGGLDEEDTRVALAAALEVLEARAYERECEAEE